MALTTLLLRCAVFYFSCRFALSSMNWEETIYERYITRSPKIIGFYPFIIPPYKIGYVSPVTCYTSTNLEGTCMTKTKCSYIRGTSYGTCGSNSRGVCCVNERSCDGNTTARVTYFNNPGYVSSYSEGKHCQLTITQQHSNICQLRVDFLTFKLEPPNYDTEAHYGECTTDYFTVYDNNLSPICGENSGQHVYLDFSPGSSIRRIAVDTGSASSSERMWSLKITQIPCNSTDDVKAPSGCLMYYNTTSGTVSSFNYGTSVPTSNEQLNWTRQITNLHYGVCVKPYPDYCSIEWTSAAGNESFSISNVSDSTSCQNTYITIPQSPLQNENTTDRYCGTSFPASITSQLRPFILWVSTSLTPTTSNHTRGFQLNFRQLPCST